jgi:hypothetical protein
LAGEKVSFLEAGISIVSPVAGLRPERAARSATLNRSKPASHLRASIRRFGDDGKRTVDDLPGGVPGDALFRGNAIDKFTGIQFDLPFS